MNFIQLNSTYRVYAFEDYRTMKAALPLLRRTPIAKEFSRLREIEVKNFVRYYTNGYQNYLRTDSAELKSTALESLKTALQALYKLNGYSAKYVVIEGM